MAKAKKKTKKPVVQQSITVKIASKDRLETIREIAHALESNADALEALAKAVKPATVYMANCTARNCDGAGFTVEGGDNETTVINI